MVMVLIGMLTFGSSSLHPKFVTLFECDLEMFNWIFFDKSRIINLLMRNNVRN